jgi:hypothetical protein
MDYPKDPLEKIKRFFEGSWKIKNNIRRILGTKLEGIVMTCKVLKLMNCLNQADFYFVPGDL